MKQRILSTALVLCLFMSSQTVAYAYQEIPLLQENNLTEEPMDGPDVSEDMITAPQEVPSVQEDVPTEGGADESVDESIDESDTGDDAIAVPQEAPSPQEDVLTESTGGLTTRDSTNLTPSGVYEAMTALKAQDAYKEGTTWTDDEPYSDTAGYYYWKGGTIDGKRISAVVRVAFAFILSDAAFGTLPARMYAKGCVYI